MSKFGVKEVCDVTFFNLDGATDVNGNDISGEPALYLDTLKLSDVENTAESVSARGGKGNPKLLTWDYNREAIMNIQDALMTTKSLAMLSGTNVLKDAKQVHKREVAGVVNGNDGTADTKYLYVEDAVYSADDFYVFKGEDEVSSDFDLASMVDIASSADTFTDADGKAVDSGYAIPLVASPVVVTSLSFGDSFPTYYKHTASTPESIEIRSDAFPGYYKIVGQTVIRNADNGLDEAFQIVIAKAKLQPNFNLSFQAEGEPSVFDMNLEVFPAQDKKMIELIKY